MTAALQHSFPLPRIVGMLALVTLAACQGEVPTSIEKSLNPGQSPRFSVYDPSTRTLGLTMAAGPRFTQDTYRKVKASVIGGNGTVYYQWYQQPCYDTYCLDQYLNGSGWGLDSSTFHLEANMSWVKITVQAFDSPNVPYSASTSTILIGPAPHNTDSNFSCNYGSGQYVIHDFYPDSGGTYSAYYRDGCDGSRKYDPDHPNLPWMEP